MSVFFELTTGVFKQQFDRAADGPRAGRAGAASVRRPTRGLEVKEDTFAMIKVIDMLGREVRLYDSGSSYGTNTYYTNFILQQVTEARTEKNQIVETFGEPYVFFYGEQARFIDCVAVLLNSQDFNWQAEFWANYDQYLRGSKCAEIGARCYLFYDDVVVEGYMMQAGALRDAQNPMAIQLQFKMFLTNYRNISLVGDPRFPVRLGVNVEFEAPTSPDNPQFTGPSNAPKLRGLIHDNWDEWTGPQPVEVPPEDPQEIDDLISAAVDEAAANAANMDRVDTLMDTAVDKAQRGEGGGGGGGSPPPAGVSGTRGMCVGQITENPIPGEMVKSFSCLDASGNTLVWEEPIPPPNTDEGQYDLPSLPDVVGDNDDRERREMKKRDDEERAQIGMDARTGKEKSTMAGSYGDVPDKPDFSEGAGTVP
jgi:hypothetical protein